MPHAITKDEVHELDEEALRWKLAALRSDRHPAHRSLTLASFETVSAELMRKRAHVQTEISHNSWL